MLTFFFLVLTLFFFNLFLLFFFLLTTKKYFKINITLKIKNNLKNTPWSYVWCFIFVSIHAWTQHYSLNIFLPALLSDVQIQTVMIFLSFPFFSCDFPLRMKTQNQCSKTCRLQQLIIFVYSNHKTTCNIAVKFTLTTLVLF